MTCFLNKIKMNKSLIFLLIGILAFVACDEQEENIDPNNDNDSDNNTVIQVPSNSLSVGASANELLSGEEYEKLIVEIQYPKGYVLPSGSVTDMENFLNKYVNKPQGIQVITTEINVPANNQYTIAEIKDIEKNNRTQFNRVDTMATYLFLADGDYEENSGNNKVLGVAYQNTSMTLFQKTIQDLSGGIGQPSERMLTSTVLMHEVGHILGLVNVGTPMVTEHQDGAHGKHCDNDRCLMFWLAETGGIVDNLLQLSSPPDLDSQCQADLKANGGK
jgi:predicted Zn-dependent protease